jgi:putative ATP-binding cassette transporter
VVTLGWVMQAAQAFQEVARALSWPVDQMPRIAAWRASAERVVALYQARYQASDGTVEVTPSTMPLPEPASMPVLDQAAMMLEQALRRSA